MHVQVTLDISDAAISYTTLYHSAGTTICSSPIQIDVAIADNELSISDEIEPTF
jgi:hypothetical protein